MIIPSQHKAAPPADPCSALHALIQEELDQCGSVVVEKLTVDKVVVPTKDLLLDCIAIRCSFHKGDNGLPVSCHLAHYVSASELALAYNPWQVLREEGQSFVLQVRRFARNGAVAA